MLLPLIRSPMAVEHGDRLVRAKQGHGEDSDHHAIQNFRGERPQRQRSTAFHHTSRSHSSKQVLAH